MNMHTTDRDFVSERRLPQWPVGTQLYLTQESRPLPYAHKKKYTVLTPFDGQLYEFRYFGPSELNVSLLLHHMTVYIAYAHGSKCHS